MATTTKIEWTDHTDNLWWGCKNVHEGCDNCYAEAWARRYGVAWGGGTGIARRAVKGVWADFLTQQAKAAAAGETRRAFVGSMMDIFEKNMPVTDHLDRPLSGGTDALRQRFFNEIVPACPDITFLLLTKRPSNINKMIPAGWRTDPPKNVMFGASVVNEKTARDVHRHLSQVNGRRFYSVEPQLEFIDFSKNALLEGISWLIQGGESGPKRRPFDPDWARHTRDVCAATPTAYFFKQIDKVLPVPEDLMVREFAGTKVFKNARPFSTSLPLRTFIAY